LVNETTPICKKSTNTNERCHLTALISVDQRKSAVRSCT
jgi:hypothetical protein